MPQRADKYEDFVSMFAVSLLACNSLKQIVPITYRWWAWILLFHFLVWPGLQSLCCWCFTFLDEYLRCVLVISSASCLFLKTNRRTAERSAVQQAAVKWKWKIKTNVELGPLNMNVWAQTCIKLPAASDWSSVLCPFVVLGGKLFSVQYYLKCNSVADEQCSQCAYNTITVHTSLR